MIFTRSYCVVDAASMMHTRVGRRVLAVSPASADVMRLVALAAMVIDHVGKAWWPTSGLIGPLAVGQIAFPIFLALHAMHFATSTTPVQRRIVTLIIAAVITEPIFDIATLPFFAAQGLPGQGTNILYTFVLLSLAYWIIDFTDWRENRQFAIGASMLAVVLIAGGYMVRNGGYGVFGIACGMAFYLAVRHSTVWTAAAALAAFGFSPAVLYSLVAVLAIAAMSVLGIFERRVGHRWQKRFLPKRFFLTAYIGHLAVIALALS